MIVYLVGMPGSGKSTVGAELAGKLGVPFIDLDVEIARTEGQPAGRQRSTSRKFDQFVRT